MKLPQLLTWNLTFNLLTSIIRILFPHQSKRVLSMNLASARSRKKSMRKLRCCWRKKLKSKISKTFSASTCQLRTWSAWTS